MKGPGASWRCARAVAKARLAAIATVAVSLRWRTALGHARAAQCRGVPALTTVHACATFIAEEVGVGASRWTHSGRCQRMRKRAKPLPRRARLPVRRS